ncbi:type 2 lanthipeptide synthetase LanM family protein [Kitasatospora sp. NPDC092948]|uniref:type 2 lanthipeptide synthetase LanM family protein n=1 Tax=Kitasatospora sp. NPDC092948 TaxID=3364088 RepID=UPI003817EBC3
MTDSTATWGRQGEGAWWAPALTLTERLTGAAGGPTGGPAAERLPRPAAGPAAVAAPDAAAGSAAASVAGLVSGSVSGSVAGLVSGFVLAEAEAQAPAADAARTGSADRRLAAWEREFDGRLDEWLDDLGADRDRLRALLAEPADRLAARTGEQPDWAAFVRRAVAAAPVDPDTSGDEPRSGADGFTAVLAPFTAAALGALRADPNWQAVKEHAELSALEADFEQSLTSRLVRIASRTLVLELNVSRVGGALHGTSGAERFADFVRQAATPGRLAALAAEYPVLARLLAHCCEDTTAAWAELAGRFTADRAALVGELFDGVDPGRLVGVRAGAGDRHAHGRTVAVLRFADGRSAVYKPRPLGVHRHWNRLLRLLGEAVPNTALRTLAALDRDAYGWLEFVEPGPCADRRGVERFYRRLGMQLALLHVLGGTDIHYENLIAAGDQPVLVDLETLFHPEHGPAEPLGGDPALRVLGESVHRISLLPFPLFGEHGALDVSGIGGDDGAPLPTPVPGWAEAGTDRMRLVRAQGHLRRAANRPRLDGQDVDPQEYTEALVAGFRAGYRALADAAPRLAAPGGLLESFAADTVRVVVRPTRRYATLLEESTHPDALRDGLDRDRLLGLLWRESADDPRRRPLVAAERDELWRGDVPLFTTAVGDGRLHADGRRYGPTPADSGLDRTRRRFAALDRTDLYDQEWIVRAALATRAGGTGTVPGTPDDRPHPPVAPDPDRLVAAACDLADRILARAHGDRHRVNWLTLEPITDRQWALMPQGAALDGGYLGTALFLAQLAALTGTARYAETARRAVRPLPALLAALAADPAQVDAVGAGGFTGLGGIAYGLARLDTLLGGADGLGEATATAVRLTALAARTAPPEDPHPDSQLLSGDAGCLAAMLAVHRITGDPEAAATADRCARRLAATPDPTPDGAAHRRWALHRYAATGRTVQLPAPGPIGTLGPAARLAAAHTPDTVSSPPPAGPAADHSLLHGDSAALELLLTGRPTGAATRAAVLLGDLDHSGPRCATPAAIPTPALLAGLAGIGHTLLRLAHPADVPCVLLLEPPRG